MTNVDNLLKFLERSENRIGSLLRRSKRWKNVEEYKVVTDELEELVPGGKVHCYGTKFMELGHERSHLNLFVDVDDAYFLTQNNDKVVELMEKFQKYLEDESKDPLPLSKDNLWIWTGPVTVVKTPIPTVRALIEPRRLQCDITFSNGLGVENTKLINRMFRLQPEAFKLYHFARIWIHIDQFAFKRYVVALMVLFYLQQINLMPSVVKMQEFVKEKFIAGWNVSFDQNKKIEDYGMDKIENFHEYLIGFFKFYAEFDFGRNVISTYLGRAVPVASYLKGDEELKKYEDQIKNFKFVAVNVADNLNLDFNCAHGVGKKRLRRFQPFCRDAVALLVENL